MDLKFTKVNYDGELSEFSEEELRELIGEFEDAQESNVAEFDEAVEQISDVDENTIEDFEKAREALIESISEAETFEQVPLSADALEDCDFSELQDWQEFVEEEQTTEDSESEFSDMGTKSPVEETEETDFADEALDDVPGLVVD
jgi:hypothetical protein